MAERVSRSIFAIGLGSLFVVISAFSIGVPSTANRLPGAYLRKVGSVQCGFHKGRWHPGTLLRERKVTYFVTDSDYEKFLKKSLKKATPSKRGKLNRTLNSLKRDKKKKAKICAAIRHIPPANPPPGQTPPSLVAPDPTSPAGGLEQRSAAYTTLVGTPVRFSLQALSGIDSPSLITGQPQYGTAAVVADNHINYSPSNGFAGTDTLTVVHGTIAYTVNVSVLDRKLYEPINGYGMAHTISVECSGTDDTAKIQNAINQTPHNAPLMTNGVSPRGGIVQLSGGVCKLSAPIQLHTGITLRGQPDGSTKLLSTASGAIIVGQTEFVHHYGYYVMENLTLESERRGTVGFQFDSSVWCYGLMFKKLRISVPGIGINLTDSLGQAPINVSDCWERGCKYGQHLLFEDITFNNAGGALIKVFGNVINYRRITLESLRPQFLANALIEASGAMHSLVDLNFMPATTPVTSLYLANLSGEIRNFKSNVPPASDKYLIRLDTVHEMRFDDLGILSPSRKILLRNSANNIFGQLTADSASVSDVLTFQLPTPNPYASPTASPAPTAVTMATPRPVLIENLTLTGNAQLNELPRHIQIKTVGPPLSPTPTPLPKINVDGPVVLPYAGQLKLVKAPNSQIISVKDFGAVGDGVADDSSKIQAAIDSIPPVNAPQNAWLPVHATVVFPPGAYRLGKALELPPGIALQGLGQSGTTIFTNSSDLIHLVTRGHHLYWGAIIDLSFSTALPNQDVIKTWGTVPGTVLHLENMIVQNGGHAIDLKNTYTQNSVFKYILAQYIGGPMLTLKGENNLIEMIDVEGGAKPWFNPQPAVVNILGGKNNLLTRNIVEPASYPSVGYYISGDGNVMEFNWKEGQQIDNIAFHFDGATNTVLDTFVLLYEQSKAKLENGSSLKVDRQYLGGDFTGFLSRNFVIDQSSTISFKMVTTRFDTDSLTDPRYLVEYVGSTWYGGVGNWLMKFPANVTNLAKKHGALNSQNGWNIQTNRTSQNQSTQLQYTTTFDPVSGDISVKILANPLRETIHFLTNLEVDSTNNGKPGVSQYRLDSTGTNTCGNVTTWHIHNNWSDWNQPTTRVCNDLTQARLPRPLKTGDAILFHVTGPVENGSGLVPGATYTLRQVAVGTSPD